MNISHILVFVLGAFIVYRIFLRVRRNITWQPLHPGKIQVFSVVFLIIGLLFLAGGAMHTVSLVSDSAGILIGLLLAVVSASITSFEVREGRLWYRPNLWIGMLVTVLFLGRLAYRLYESYAAGAPAAGQAAASVTDRLASIGYDSQYPWASGLLLMMIAYYFTYNLILLRKGKRAPRLGS